MFTSLSIRDGTDKSSAEQSSGGKMPGVKGEFTQTSSKDYQFKKLS